MVVGINGSKWIFVKASATVTANNMVAIDCNFSAYNLSASLAASLKYNVGIAQFSATLANTGEYFWALLTCAGGAVVNFVTAAASGTQLYRGGGDQRPPEKYLHQQHNHGDHCYLRCCHIPVRYSNFDLTEMRKWQLQRT
jgi:hypothetical protein